MYIEFANVSIEMINVNIDYSKNSIQRHSKSFVENHVFWRYTTLRKIVRENLLQRRWKCYDKKIRFYIESNRLIIEFEIKQNDINIDWMFLKRFKKNKKWKFDDFVQKKFEHEMKRLFKFFFWFQITNVLRIAKRYNWYNFVFSKTIKLFQLENVVENLRKKNHFAIFKNHRIYIKFKMNDIRTKIRFKS